MTQSVASGGATERDHAIFWREAMLFSVLALLAMGLLMALTIDGPFRGVWPALAARAGRILLGLAMLWLAWRLRLDRLRELILPFYVSALFLCILPRLLGDTSHGAYRWINLGPLSLQPVELLKIMSVLATAEILERRRPVLDSLRYGVLPVVAVPMAGALVLLSQPDVGHAFFLIAICGLLVMVGGVRPWHSLILVAVAGLALYFALDLFDHTQSRYGEFRSGKPGFQLGRSLMAFAEGGLAGQGPGGGWMKMGFVPEARNDFVLAIVGNELGLAGSLLVVGLFALFFQAGMSIVARAASRWHALVALGLTMTVVVQAMMNVLGVTFTIPEKGIDLPFLSSGGTNLVFALASVGMLMNVAKSSTEAGRASLDGA